jgi:hypothetical protein
MLKMKMKATSECGYSNLLLKHIRHRSRYIPGSVGEGADSPSVAVATVATVEGAIVV